MSDGRDMELLVEISSILFDFDAELIDQGTAERCLLELIHRGRDA